jgi:tetratricopeptide (TPR) repeat protein
MVDVRGASDGARFWMVCRGALLIAEGDPEAALRLIERVAPLYAPATNPIWAPWRSVKARALAALGRVEQADAVALEELALAQRVAAPWAIGRIHRLLAQIGGPDALRHARRAVALLSQSSARLELAKAQAALGECLAAEGDRDGAAEALTSALEHARWCGADALYERAETALGALGTARLAD